MQIVILTIFRSWAIRYGCVALMWGACCPVICPISLCFLVVRMLCPVECALVLLSLRLYIHTCIYVCVYLLLVLPSFVVVGLSNHSKLSSDTVLAQELHSEVEF